MVGKIFLNYRRGDDPGFAQALFGRLEHAFSHEQLFMDIDSIAPGLDFVRVLDERVAESDVLLAIIGRGWVDARNAAGTRRLDDPDDFVRIEIESALNQGKRVIPVLVGEAKMPRAEELPEALRPLARRNAVRLTHERFRADTQGLVKALQQALEEIDAVRRRQAKATARELEEQAAIERAKALREREEQAQRDKEQARLVAIAGLSAEQIAKAEELANWDFIKDSARAQDFRDHLARFAHGVCERMAQHKLEALVWAALGEAPDPLALASHLEEFPEGAHAEQARTLLSSTERAESGRETLPGEVFAKFQLEVEQEVHRQNTAADAKVPQQEEPAEVETSSAIVPRADPVGPSDKRAIEGWGLALLVILIGGTLAVPLAITIETAKDPNSQPEAVSVTTPPAPAVQPAPAPSFLTRFLTPNSLALLSPEREQALKRKDTFKECDKCPEMVVVPAGSFTMGSPANEANHQPNEGPQHRVTFARPFAVGKFALTYDEWNACVADGGCNGSWPGDRTPTDGRQPAVKVSWSDAKAYVTWLSKKTGKPYRLLSEAEREYVTRAGTTTAYYFGDDVAALGQYGWYSANSDARTHPVGEKKPNGFGLYDMHGNVWDWTEDCYHDSYNGAPSDGTVPWTTGDCSHHVIRGGSWFDLPGNLRSARRTNFAVDNRDVDRGFRVGRTLVTP